jgi:hypothetical protein
MASRHCFVVHGRLVDKTEDSEFEAESLRSVGTYLKTREDSKIHMTDIVKEFPQISKVSICHISVFILCVSCFVQLYLRLITKTITARLLCGFVNFWMSAKLGTLWENRFEGISRLFIVLSQRVQFKLCVHRPPDDRGKTILITISLKKMIWIVLSSHVWRYSNLEFSYKICL